MESFCCNSLSLCFLWQLTRRTAAYLSHVRLNVKAEPERSGAAETKYPPPGVERDP